MYHINSSHIKTADAIAFPIKITTKLVIHFYNSVATVITTNW